DGAVFVDLAPVRQADLVVPTVARTLGLREEGGQPPLAALADRLATRGLLLVLDNCERVLAAAPDVASLLATCPGLKVLATSRARLRVRGEREYPVKPLALPNPRLRAGAAEVAASPAVALFAERARSAAPAFEVTEDNAPDVAAICARLDGLP